MDVRVKIAFENMKFTNSSITNDTKIRSNVFSHRKITNYLRNFYVFYVFAVTFQNLLSPIIIHNILFPSFDFYDADVFVWCMDYAAICMCSKIKAAVSC